MTTLVLVVPSKGLAPTPGKIIAPYFVVQAGVPQRYLRWPYGYIGRQPKGDDYVNVWKLADSVGSGAAAAKAAYGLPLGVDDGIGDDGVLSWRIALGRSDTSVFEAAVNVHDGALVRIFQQNGQVVLPDSIALVVPQDLDEVRAACEHLSIETVIINHAGQLALGSRI